MIATTGFFDGVHLGHRLVLEKLVSLSRERGEDPLVVTFWPHPRAVLQSDARDLRLLSSLDEKKALIASMGISRVEVVPFTRDFAAMTAREYLGFLRDRFGVACVVMGYDNRIGSDGLTAADLDGYGVEVVAFGQQASVRNVPSEERSFSGAFARIGSRSDAEERDLSSEGTVSSTKIRKALEEGRVEAANAMLGYRYGLDGAVVPGNRLGRTIGFPTANIREYEPLKLIPANGVYEVAVLLEGEWLRGMCNVGIRPTVGGTTRTVETHILDFDRDIYGLPLRIEFIRRIREERHFPSLEALSRQLQEDKDCIIKK